MVAVVPLGGAIRVCHHCYPGRHACLQVRPSHYLPGAVGRGQCRAVRCGGEEGRGLGACCGVSPVRAGAGGHPSA